MRDVEKPADSGLPEPFRLVELTVDPLSGELVGPRGRERVDPKVMHVLTILAQHAGQVVTRDALHAAVWPGVIVTDEALTRCIYLLRRHFANVGGGREWKSLLETLPKRGYRLNVPAPTPASPAAARAEPVISAAPVASAAAHGVAWRSWSRRGLSAAAAAVLLLTLAGDAFVPSGSFRTIGARAQELLASGNAYFERSDRAAALPWAVRQYERAIEEEPRFALAWARLGIAHTAVHWLGIDRTPERLANAKAAIDEALELDPDLPEAHVALGNYHFRAAGDYAAAAAEFAIAERTIPRDPLLLFLRSGMERRAGAWEQARTHVDTALAARPDDVVFNREHHFTLLYQRDYARAERTLDRLLDTHPDDSSTYWSRAFLALCRDGDAALAREYERSRPSAARANDYAYVRWLAAIFAGDYARALALLESVGDAPLRDEDLRTLTPRDSLLGQTYRLAGNDAEARRRFERVAVDARQRLAVGADAPRDQAYTHLALAEAEAGLGRAERARDALRQARALLPKSRDALAGSALQHAGIVRVLVPAGYYDEAFSELADYLGAPGHWSIEGLRRDPRLAGLRDDARFVALVAAHRPP